MHVIMVLAERRETCFCRPLRTTTGAVRAGFRMLTRTQTPRRSASASSCRATPMQVPRTPQQQQQRPPPRAARQLPRAWRLWSRPPKQADMWQG